MNKETLERVGELAAAAGAAASVGLVAWVVRDLEKSFGPSPKKAERERLAMSADELEVILESRRRTAERYRQELELQDPEDERRRELDYRAFAERFAEMKRQEERLAAERRERRWGPVLPLFRELEERARRLERRADQMYTQRRPGEAERRVCMEIRRELGLHSYNFGRDELEQGDATGVLTPGEHELLKRMRRTESRNRSG